jgi:hypothetical protein
MDQVWRDLMIGDLKVYDVPGDHFSMNFLPNVQIIADLLKDCLNYD